MLAALKDECWQPGIKFLDPACGTGNFLVAVVEKKIEAGLSAKEAIKTTYGVDIMEDNIIECRRRINKLTNYAHTDLVDEQITHGNFLNNE
jgi:ubiquinone/menaquinone biosynthesis C-methylase UbiE